MAAEVEIYLKAANVKLKKARESIAEEDWLKFKEEDQSTTKDEAAVKEVTHLKAEQEASLKGELYVTLVAEEEPRVKEEEFRFFEK